MHRDYSSFPREISKRLKSIFADYGMSRVTDSIYASESDGFWRVVFFELSRADGKDFYVTYGVAIPDLGAPWFGSVSLKHSGLLVSERLYGASGQGFPCHTLEALGKSCESIQPLLGEKIVPWFESLHCLSRVAEEYFRRWGIEPPGKNSGRARQGVLNFALLQLHLGDISSAVTWLWEALRLADLADDADDRDRIKAVLAAQNAS